jgi:hypothetical protein
MPAVDQRPALLRHESGKSQEPLLDPSRAPHIIGYDSPPRLTRRRSTFHGRDPEVLAQQATRRRYSLAALFLVLSLVSFCLQTETASYIQKQLKWDKAYCMLSVPPPPSLPR